MTKFSFLAPAAKATTKATRTTTKAGKAKTAAPPAPEAPRRVGRPRGGKSGDPNYHPLTVYVPRDLHRQVKARLVADDGGELSELVAALLAGWLKGGKAERP